MYNSSTDIEFPLPASIAERQGNRGRFDGLRTPLPAPVIFLFGYLFGCKHYRKPQVWSWPHRRQDGSRYVVCTECGLEKDYLGVLR